jgi:hypothetical protein
MEIRRAHDQLIGAVADYYGIRLRFGGNWDDDDAHGLADSTVRDFAHIEIHEDERQRLDDVYARTGKFYEGRSLYQGIQSAGFGDAMRRQKASTARYTPQAPPLATTDVPTESAGYTVDQGKRNP